MEEYFQKVAETVTKILRKYKDIKNAVLQTDDNIFLFHDSLESRGPGRVGSSAQQEIQGQTQLPLILLLCCPLSCCVD